MEQSKVFTDKVFTDKLYDTFSRFGVAKNKILGTKGARVIQYLKQDGTVGKAITPTDYYQKTLKQTDHSNEEIVRVLNLASNTYCSSVTFVGTGLDVKLKLYKAVSIKLDGLDIGTLMSDSNTVLEKICSGLPYGTHILHFETDCVEKLVVYAPKKPTMPNKAVELADYCLLADHTR